jgi:hypothetical protein
MSRITTFSRLTLLRVRLTMMGLSVVVGLALAFASSATPALAYQPNTSCGYVCITSIEMNGDTSFVVHWVAGIEVVTKRILRWWPENNPRDPLQAGQIDLEPGDFSASINNRLPYTKYIVEIESCNDVQGCLGWSEQSYIVTPGASNYPDPAAVSWGAGRLDVVVRGPTNDYLHTYWDGSWHSYESLGGSFVTDPAISTRGPGRLDIFGIGTDHRLYQKSWPEDAAVWNRGDSWHLVGGIFSSKVAAVSWASNRIDVVGRGGDNAVWHLYWNEGGGWAQDRLGNISSSQAAGWAPAIAAPRSGQLVVATIGASDSSMYVKTWPQDAGIWNQDAWWHVGGYFTSSPAAVSRGAGQVDVFGRGGDGAIWHAFGSSGTGLVSQLATDIPGTGFTRGHTRASASSSGPSLSFSPFESIGGTTSGAPTATSQGPGAFDTFVLYGHTLFQKSWPADQSHWNQNYWNNLSAGQNVCSGCYSFVGL